MSTALTLNEALHQILSLAKSTETETICLDHALGRVSGEILKANLPVPSFNHSTRDGYAVKSLDIKEATTSGPITLKITGEIQAGCTSLPALDSGQALRIMTGGAIPPGCDLVMAQEDIQISTNSIIVNQPSQKGTFIRKNGCDYSKGELMIQAGERLTPDHLAILATAGINDIKVHHKPAVAVICTGTELVSHGEIPRPGQVISSNRLLLDGLIRTNGGTTETLITAPDKKQKITDILKAQIDDQLPLIITTGGMGPGKFDLMAEVFTDLKINTIYKSLLVRPGRATMLAIKNKSLVFALPGPPPAVRLLFNELVKPALLKLGGIRTPLNKSIQAELSENIEIRAGQFLHLKGGNYFTEGGRLLVNPSEKGKPGNCVILLAQGRRHIRKGERITIHPITNSL